MVHENHGLGIYRGIEKVEVDKVMKDYMKIEYAGGSNLYISGHAAGCAAKICRFGCQKTETEQAGRTGVEKDQNPRTGGGEKYCPELVSLYAARQGKEGYAYGKDTVWQRELRKCFLLRRRKIS